jgi:hypothetical protein
MLSISAQPLKMADTFHCDFTLTSSPNALWQMAGMVGVCVLVSKVIDSGSQVGRIRKLPLLITHLRHVHIPTRKTAKFRRFI